MALAAYLANDLSTQYLSMLPSRWAALLPRIARGTRQLQEGTATYDSVVGQELQKDFALADQLLHQEHEVYRRGIELAAAKGVGSTTDSSARAHLSLLLRGVLVELAKKEAMMAHWRSAAAVISADTLRVYSHAMLAPSQVTQSDVERLQILL